MSSVDFALISAPLPRSILEIAMFPLTQARWSAVMWAKSFSLISTLAWSRSSSATLWFPRRAAKWSAVLLLVDAIAGLAPLWISNFTVATQLNLKGPNWARKRKRSLSKTKWYCQRVQLPMTWKASQPTSRDATTGFPAKWRLRNERRISILMTRR